MVELRRAPETAVYQVVIDGLEYASAVSGECWDVVSMNHPCIEGFKGVRRHAMAHPARNTTAFIPFHPDAPTCSAETIPRPSANAG
jgi:hypothetical protein